MQRYEQLRRHAVAGETGDWRHGLALLQRRGLAAWARAWLDPPEPRRPATRPLAPAAHATSGELVGALATMALACERAR